MLQLLVKICFTELELNLLRIVVTRLSRSARIPSLFEAICSINSSRKKYKVSNYANLFQITTASAVEYSVQCSLNLQLPHWEATIVSSFKFQVYEIIGDGRRNEIKRIYVSWKYSHIWGNPEPALN